MEAFQVVNSPDIVDVLRLEHDQIRQMCTDVRTARPGRKPFALVALQRAVNLHQLGERTVAHPAARDCGPDGNSVALDSQAEGEHNERTLTEISRLGVEHPDFDARFAALAAALLDHAARQERDEFPLLRRYVPTQRLHMLTGAMRDVRIMASF